MITLDHVIEIALLILGFYLAGCVIGYSGHRLARRLTAGPSLTPPQASMVVTPVPRSGARRLAQLSEREEAAVIVPTSQMQRPPSLPGPRSGRADDLRKIKGIGPKTEQALNDQGIYHFDQIAGWDAVHVDWLDGRVAIKGRIRREQWIEQAVLLATEPVLRQTG
ncbi:hypothetical protein [Devosia faecipullorum]|uniref:hypothetical protein n=1 Tax=Devosia faecipullorum TaxID=2755039 RepID=UPI00187B9A1B|nr:hypothetical protein [Devosia faecipullorum]MBE7734478.1 hypothetical protein [Devosia faecipullorum]